MPGILVDTGDALLNKTDRSLCPHGAHILVGRETMNIPTSKTNSMSEGGKCYGAKRIRERLMTAHVSSSGSHRRPGRQDNMGQRFTGGEGASLWVPWTVVHAVETNVCKDLEGGVFLVLSLTSVYLTSPYSATCTQISWFFHFCSHCRPQLSWG